MRHVSLFLVLALLATPARAAAPPSAPTLAEQAAARGLAYLRRSQQKTGHWGKRGVPAHRAAITSLAVMAFLSAGRAPDQGPHGEAITRGIRAVLRDQQPTGLLAPEGDGLVMYSHGMSLLMLAQAHAVAPEGLRKDIRKALDRAVALSLKSQSSFGQGKGGWSYSPRATGSADMSVTGWNFVGLLAARDVGCVVPAERVAWAEAFVRRCHQIETGGFGYMGPGRTPCCTAEGALALALTSKWGAADPAVRAALANLSEEHAIPSEGYPRLTFYLAMRALCLSKGLPAARARQALTGRLLREQLLDGGWAARSSEEAYGPDLCTALGVLALTAPEWRLPPFRPRPGLGAPGGGPG
jgi:hypothetical protein